MEQNIELMDKMNVIEGQMGEFWAKIAEFEQICGVNLDQTLATFCKNDQKSAKNAKKEPTKSFLKGLAKQIEAVKNDLVPELEVVINEKKLENAGVKSTKLLFELADLQLKTETKRQKYDEIGQEISQNLVHLKDGRAKKKALTDAIQQNANSAKKQMENIGKMLKKFKNSNSKKMEASASIKLGNQFLE
ncbi:hypothetical protein niasHS_004210 [Heterodera schachtii]|uniref:Uncharacterized protein n=1 Tax=Heterodera schachtii TaxID=97005 RepID=A0ABD2JT77_HETSC